MAHRVKPLPFKPSRLDGLSERLLVSHYENNYGGAVRRLNAIEDELARLDPAAAPGFLLNGLKREEIVAANSMILHEVYFDALGGDGAGPAGELAAAVEAGFGSVERWRAEFTAMGKALAGGSGWVVLAWSPRHGRLVNQWAADHTQALAGAEPVLALDMYEHAYHLDFGARAAAYVDAFMRNIAWARVGEHFAAAHRAPAAELPAAALPAAALAAAELDAARAGASPPIVLDVRRGVDRAKDAVALPGAQWRDPETVAEWADGLPAGGPVVVYCAYGFEVGQGVAAELARRGRAVHFLAGGLAAWRAEGGPVQAVTEGGTP
jgi:Fe-Mn family superoxide dismutase